MKYLPKTVFILVDRSRLQNHGEIRCREDVLGGEEEGKGYLDETAPTTKQLFPVRLKHDTSSVTDWFPLTIRIYREHI